MKIAMIGTRGVPAHYGGFETAVEEIGARLVAAGEQVTVFRRPVAGELRSEVYRGMRLVSLPALRRRSLETLSHTALSVLHPALAGVDAAIVFNAANAPLLPVLRARRIPVATHVDGLEWRRSKWGAAGRQYYRLAESLAVRWSDALIADAAGIADYYRDEFGAVTHLISYGAPQASASDHRLAELALERRGYHLVVARFERENHVLEIVRGYVASRSRRPLVVVGSAPYSGDYAAEIDAAAAGDDRVRLLGGIWDQELLDQLYANALCYLHGHSVGGTNPSLLRAVGAGTPTLAFDSVFNREVLGAAGWYFDDPPSVSRHLELIEADAEGRAFAAARLVETALRYDWDDVAERYLALCRGLVGGERMPKRSGRRRRPGWKDVPGGTPEPPVVVAHPSPDLYGSDRVLLESVTAFLDAGRRVVVALPQPGPLADELTAAGAGVRFLASPVLRKSALSAIGMVRLGLDALRGLGPALGLLRELRPGLLYVNTLTIPLWLVAARITGTPAICHVHEAEQSARPLVRKALYAPLLLANRILVNSGFSEDVVVRSWPILRRRTGLLYNGVPGPTREPSPPRSSPDPLRMLFVGRLSARKGPQVAIEALAVLRRTGVDAELLLLGAVFPGYEWFEQELRAQVERLELDDRVRFLGFNPEIWDNLAEADVVLVPSTVDEPFGNTAVEAMLARRPLVVSRTSGLCEAAAGYRSVRFVTPGDPASIAEAVRNLLENWPTVRDQGAEDRALAMVRHDPRAYRSRLVAMCTPGRVTAQARTTSGA